MSQREAHQQRHRSSGRAFLASALPGGAGDVEVRPAQLTREAREKARGGNAACGTPAYVREIGEVRAQLLLVVFPERHLPDAVPGVVGRSFHFFGELLVVREKSRGD